MKILNLLKSKFGIGIHKLKSSNRKFLWISKSNKFYFRNLNLIFNLLYESKDI
jgi:hypothetical protein